MECENGNFSTNLNFTKFGLVRPGRNKDHILNNFDQSCTNWASFLYSIQNCSNKKTCQFEYNESWILNECDPSDQDIGYLRVFCESKKNYFYH